MRLQPGGVFTSDREPRHDLYCVGAHFGHVTRSTSTDWGGPLGPRALTDRVAEQVSTPRPENSARRGPAQGSGVSRCVPTR